MKKLIDENALGLLVTPEAQDIPEVIVVRGIARNVGSTSIAANLGLLLSRRQERVLLLDLSLWNRDLTRVFGHSPNSDFGSLAQQFYEKDNLPFETLQTCVRFCRQNLDLLPGGEHWLETVALRAENGWNFIWTLLAVAKGYWNFIIADVGSDTQNQVERTNYNFTTSCGVHAAMLYASKSVASVCDSIDYLKLWQDQGARASYLQSKEQFIVNQYRRDLIFGFDMYAVEAKLRSQSHSIPLLKTGLLANSDGLFLVERGTVSGDLSREERNALWKLDRIADRFCRVP